MRRRIRWAFALAIAGTAPAAVSAAAQSSLSVKLTLPPPAARATQEPVVSVANMFASQRSHDLLANGFPGRVIITVELWATQFGFDELLGTVSWQRVVRYDLVNRKYRIARVVADSLVEEARVDSIQSVQRLLSRTEAAPIIAPRGRRGLYYTVTAVVETLSSNDLAEIQRWLSGDLRKSLSSDPNPAPSIWRGVRTILSRLLGGDSKRETASSEKFNT